MARLVEILEKLNDGEAATRASPEGDFTIWIHRDIASQAWIVQRSAAGMPPHPVLSFEDTEDVAAYFQASAMNDHWTVTPLRR